MNAVSAYCNRTFTLGQCFAWLGLAVALLTLGAHFYRSGEYGIVACAAGALVFMCLESRWKQYAVAFFLLWGMLEWGESAMRLAVTRMGFGMPWMRGAGIIGAVALVTGLAGWGALLRARRLDAGREDSTAFFQGAVFICVFLALFYLRRGAKMDFLLLERYLPIIGSVQIFFASWYAAFIAGRLADHKKSRQTRRLVWLIFACVFFLQFFLGALGFDKMLLTGKLHVPIPAFIVYAPIFRESFSMMPAIVLAATLLAGSAWCSMLCYFGPFDSLAAGAKAARPYPAWAVMLQRYGRPATLVLGSLLAFLLGRAGLSYAMAASLAAAFAFFSLLLMALVSRRWMGMFHCTAFCPMGLVVNLLGRVSPWRIRVDRDSCDNCQACEKICKYSAITHESRQEGKTLLRCSLCRDCIGACKSKAVYVHFPGLGRDAAWKVFVGLVTALHVLFFSIAMV